MSLNISHVIEGRINDEARRQGISVDALLEQLLTGHETTARSAGSGSAPELPRLHLGVMGALHSREIYDDVC
jgi:hypothetical protein